MAREREVLVAPDKFKGTLTAAQVAQALGRGLAATGARVDLCPVADGGDGTLLALSGPLAAEARSVVVSDPLGRPVLAQYAIAEGRGGATAIVELASASGYALVALEERDAIAASSYGTGQLIAAAIADGARTVLVGAGGSATTDGGTGAISAIEDAGGLSGAKLIVLCDVRTPFEDAARVFGPQKGADPDAVRKLTQRLHRQARGFARDPRGRAMTGAAGGFAGGMWARFGAELVAGAPFVLDEVGFDARMRAARAVITGEGALDTQSLAGKAVSEVATRCRQSGVPCYAAVGRLELDAFGRRILDLERVFEAGSIDALEAAGMQLGELLS